MNLIEIPGQAYLWAVEIDGHAVGAVQYLKASHYILLDIHADIIGIDQYASETEAAITLLEELEINA